MYLTELTASHSIGFQTMHNLHSHQFTLLSTSYCLIMAENRIDICSMRFLRPAQKHFTSTELNSLTSKTPISHKITHHHRGKKRLHNYSTTKQNQQAFNEINNLTNRSSAFNCIYLNRTADSDGDLKRGHSNPPTVQQKSKPLLIRRSSSSNNKSSHH